MIDGIETVLRTMQNDVKKLGVVGQNLANIQTTAFKRLFDNVHTSDAVQAAGNSSQLRSASLTNSADLSQGPLKNTGSKLNIAIEGDGFFQVRGDNGLLLTRKGELKIDDDGYLSLLSGERLQGADGDILLQPGAFEIDREGNVYQDSDQASNQILVISAPLHALSDVGNGNYANTAGERVETSKIRQGFLEASNVNHLQEMTRLIELTRHFETSQQVLQSYNVMLEEAVTKLGRV